ncbi:phosphotransferase [Devosia sp.]|uniref:phosphotransferase enzyme family protein n=1 Tax=Devosia sp. TaxID=1871048 RepID=UPI003265CF2C
MAEHSHCLDENAVLEALSAWPETDCMAIRLLNHSENHTFLLTAADGPRFTLRVHRPGYQSAASINSELAWLAALGASTDLPLARPVAGRDGQLLQTINLGEQAPRFAVLFEFIAGTEPTLADDLEPIFERLGEFAATMHRHAAMWQPPQGFERQLWSAGKILDADGLWGDWRIAPGVDESARRVLNRLDTVLRTELDEYDSGPERFGLIHADMRLGNLLVDGAAISLIDFDDCGFCWFAYDFAAAISFHETDASAPMLKAAWLRGYLPVRPLAAADIAAMDTMVLLRRMALLAWIGSHAETALAQTHMSGFAEGTVRLARAFLDDRGVAIE